MTFTILYILHYENNDIQKITFHYLFYSGLITRCPNKENTYKLPAKEVENVLIGEVMDYWNELVFGSKKDDISEIASKLDFYKDDTEEILYYLEEIINKAVENVVEMNEQTFEFYFCLAHHHSAKNVEYKKGIHPNTGEGY